MCSSGGDAGGPGVHDVDRGVALLREAVDLLTRARSWSRSQEEVRAALAEVTRLGHALEAGRLNLIRASPRTGTCGGWAPPWPPETSPLSTWTSPARR